MKTPSDVTQPPPKSTVQATDERYLHTQPPPIDPAVWRTEIPLIVAERCNSPHLLAVWFALRWLMAAFPQSRGFGTRIIAQRARVSHKYVTGWVAELIEHGLVEVIGEEPMRNLAPRPIYTIPLHRLEAMSNAMAVDVLMNYGVKHLPSPPPPNPDQLPLGITSATDTTGGAQQPEHHHTNQLGHTVAPANYDHNISTEIPKHPSSGDISPPGSVVTREHLSGDISPPGSGDIRDQRNTSAAHTDHVPQRDQNPGDIKDQTPRCLSTHPSGGFYPTESVVIREQAQDSSLTPSVVPQEQSSVPLQEQTSEVIHPYKCPRDQKEQTPGDQKGQTSQTYTQREQTSDPNKEQNLVDNKEHTYQACMHGTGQDLEHGRHGNTHTSSLHKEEEKAVESTAHLACDSSPEIHAHTATVKRHPPPVPPGEFALPLHPFDLWYNACPHVRSLDYAHIEALAAEHDLVTNGHGMYWVGRAILSATLASDARYLKVIKVVLDRWRNEGTYGSEAPWEQQRREQRKEQYNGAATTSSRENSQSKRTTARRSPQSGRVEASRVTITDEDLTRFLRAQPSDVK